MQVHVGRDLMCTGAEEFNKSSIIVVVLATEEIDVWGHSEIPEACL